MEYLDNTGRQRLGDVLRDAIGDDVRLSIVASCMGSAANAFTLEGLGYERRPGAGSGAGLGFDD